jgi:hypothetical protein
MNRDSSNSGGKQVTIQPNVLDQGQVESDLAIPSPESIFQISLGTRDWSESQNTGLFGRHANQKSWGQRSYEHVPLCQRKRPRVGRPRSIVAPFGEACRCRRNTSVQSMNSARLAARDSAGRLGHELETVCSFSALLSIRLPIPRKSADRLA